MTEMDIEITLDKSWCSLSMSLYLDEVSGGSEQSSLAQHIQVMVMRNTILNAKRYRSTVAIGSNSLPRSCNNRYPLNLFAVNYHKCQDVQS